VDEAADRIAAHGDVPQIASVGAHHHHPAAYATRIEVGSNAREAGHPSKAEEIEHTAGMQGQEREGHAVRPHDTHATGDRQAEMGSPKTKLLENTVTHLVAKLIFDELLDKRQRTVAHKIVSHR